MSVVRQLETKVAGWLKPVPPLPKNVQKWLADNVWWLAIVSAVASVISIFVLISAIIAYTSYTNTFVGFYAAQTYASGWIFTVLLSLLFSIVITLLTVLAISPLKRSQKKGWDLLFLVLLVEAVSLIVNAIASLNLFGFIVGILVGGIALAIGVYFLFSIRSYFVKTTKEGVPPWTAVV